MNDQQISSSQNYYALFSLANFSFGEWTGEQHLGPTYHPTDESVNKISIGGEENG
jgi:hypothetical protein